MTKNNKKNFAFKYKSLKDYRDNINLPIHEYNFYYDFDDRFLKYQYGRMWKHICLLVEQDYGEEIEKEVTESNRKFYLDFLVSHGINESNINSYLEKFMSKAEYEIRKKKQLIAMRLMKEKIKKINEVKKDSDTYILTEEEKKKREKEIDKGLKDLYIKKIEGNGIYIELNGSNTLFRFKNGKEYIINSFMSFTGGEKIDLRALEIIEACGEASLYYKWIAKIFRASERVIYNILKPYGYNVNLSSKKELKNLDKIKILDDSGYFIIEVENTKKQTN